MRLPTSVDTLPKTDPCRQCGQATIDGRTCTTDYYDLLVREREQSPIGRYHGVVVPCYLLQHGDGIAGPARDIRWRLLEAFTEHGIEAVPRLQAHLRRQNSHRR